MINQSPIPSNAPVSARDPSTRAWSEAPRLDDPPPELPARKPRVPFGERWRQFPSTRSLWLCLLLITAAGAFLRFWRLDHQTYWTDEHSTIIRIRDSFKFMLSTLTNQGFPPGWYAMLRWWCVTVENYTHNGAYAFSPESARALPALFGTLTIPAVYFLARQFTDRKGALLVMLLAAVNPFFIYYSRDIKMYAALWFFCTLNMAIFFRWQTTHKHFRWLPFFIITGVLMTAMQSMAWFMVALQFIFLLTRPRLKALDGPLWLFATGFTAALPVYWYTHKSIWFNRLAHDDAGGLAWLTRYTDMSWKTIISLPCAHLLGYLWPVYPNDNTMQTANKVMYAVTTAHPTTYPAKLDATDWIRVKEWFSLGGLDFDKHIAARSWPDLVHAEIFVALAFFAILLLGLIPWRGIRRSPERAASITQHRWWWVALWIILPSLALALTWIPETSIWHNRIWGNFDPPAVWEPRYLGMIVPAWLLWMGASLRRLPTWPLRTLAILFVLAACTFSSLSNHLLLRNAPFQQPAQIAMKYFDPKNPNAIAVGNPAVAFPPGIEWTYMLAAGQRPSLNPEPVIPDNHFRENLFSSTSFVAFVQEMRLKPEIKTIILTDRYGDITDPKELISNEALAKRLGPTWKLIDEQSYEWHYEWRFYIFHIWRTRVWVRIPPPATTSAATNR